LLILVTSLALAILGVTFYAQSTGGGFTVTGVSLINVLHPGQLLNASQPPSQAKWAITTVFNGGGQSLVANLDNTSINYRDSEGRLITSAYPLQISGYTNPETAIYTISNQQPEPIDSFSSQVELGWVRQGIIQQNASNAPSCPSSYSYEWDFTDRVQPKFLGPYYTYTIARVCIYETLVGNEYPISLADTQFSSDLTLTANGQPETLNLNSNSTSAISPDGLVQAQWVGSLVTGTQAPTNPQSVAISNINNNQWDIQNVNEYSGTQGYTNHIPTFQSGTYNATTISRLSSSCQGIFNPSDITNASLANVAACMNDYAQNQYSINNQYASQLLTSGSTIEGNGNSYSATQTNYNGEPAFAISLGSSSFTTNPEIIFTLSGTFVGVVIPVGKPKILSVSSSSFTSGSTGIIKVNVENVGDAQGSFYATLSDCQGISPTQSATNYQVQPGQSQQINVSITTSGINQTINQQCMITVTDYNGGGSDTAQVNIVSKPANQCTPNSQVVQGASICPCLNESGVWKLGTGSSCSTCSYGVIANGNGGYECAPPPSTSIAGQPTTIQSTTTISYNQTFGHKDVVIATIGSKLNEDSAYKTALSSYENVLTSEGLSYIYVELNSYNPNMNVNDWISIKSTINRIEYLTNATYLIILGGTDIVPMPNVSTSVSFSAPAYYLIDNSNPNIIFTDDPYGSLTNNNNPSVVVARFPGTTADDIATIMLNDVKKHNNNNYGLLIVGDGLNGSDDAFVGYDTNQFSLSATRLSCSDNSNCFHFPPYCLGLICNDSSSFENLISNTYGIQFYGCHGDGYVCGDSTGAYTVIASAPLQGVSIASMPKFNTNPIIITVACYDGAIDNGYLLVPSVLAGGSRTLALQALNNGASVYIGNTKEGFGGLSESEESYIYNNFKNGMTIGKAFLSMKVNYLKNPYDAYQEGTAHELQLYGDPTLTYG
jgi:hypothetical protein